MGVKRGKLRIGTSGYHYDHWKEVFYPRHLPEKRWFAYYARHFDTVEINNTFYHLPQVQSFEVWREQAPPNSCFALKFSRYGSHLKRLKEPHASIAQFLDRVHRLRESLGPILVQLGFPVSLEKFVTVSVSVCLNDVCLSHLSLPLTH